MLTEEQIERYSRQIILPEVGGRGQETLLRAKILVLGAGRRGSAALLYLAAAGVGTLGIADRRVVSTDDLAYQILYNTLSRGLARGASACRVLTALNPDCEVVTHQTDIGEKILSSYDVIVDGAESLSDSYQIHDWCHFLAKPFVFARESGGGRGEVTVFWSAQPSAPCLRCIYPQFPSVFASGHSETSGAAAGLIGILQAVEAIKLILRAGELLIGTMVVYDAPQTKFFRTPLKKDPACPLCRMSR